MSITEQKIEVEKVADLAKLDEFYKGSYYTITGAGGPTNTWTTGYIELLEKENIGKPTKFYTFTGKQMNEKYQLAGDVAYNPDLTFISFPLENLDTGKLAIFKLRMQDRWFDDIVDNNTRHMEA